MRSNTRNYILTAACTVAALLFCQPLHAIATISVNFTGINGTYPSATTTNNPSGSPSWTTQLVFCLDGNQVYSGGTGVLANTSTTVTATEEEEAAFLVAYAGTLDPTHNNSTIESNIQTAIWDVMGTRATSETNTANAVTYASLAVTDVAAHPTLFAIGSSFMNTVLVWTPTGFTVNTGSTIISGNQRFISAGSMPPGVLSSAPEPSTVVFLGTGMLLMALSRIRRRKQSPRGE
jgi:hypothetical protein